MRILFSMGIVKDFSDKPAFIWRDFWKIRGVIMKSFSPNRKKERKKN
jgi:hypothetical protein